MPCGESRVSTVLLPPASDGWPDGGLSLPSLTRSFVTSLDDDAPLCEPP